jgi:hypothetical protein
VQHPCTGNQQTPSSGPNDAGGEVRVLPIGDVPFIEGADPLENCPPISRRAARRTEHFHGTVRDQPQRLFPQQCATVGVAGDAQAGGVDPARVLVLQHQSGEAGHVGVSFGRLDHRGDELRIGLGVVVQQYL